MPSSPSDILTQVFVEVIKAIWLPGLGLLLFVGAATLLIDLISRKSRVRWFLGKKKIQDLQQLSPPQFESYVEELFRVLGYKTRAVGGRGDGGIDVEAERDGVTHYIQCKKYITRQVPVGAVRDFYGAIADRVGSGKGYFITTNVFTLDAEKFAEDKPIELVDRFKLMEYMRLANVDVPAPNTTTCPKCGGQLVQRRSKYGEFLGCNNYPRCTYTANP